MLIFLYNITVQIFKSRPKWEDLHVLIVKLKLVAVKNVILAIGMLSEAHIQSRFRLKGKGCVYYDNRHLLSLGTLFMDM